MFKIELNGYACSYVYAVSLTPYRPQMKLMNTDKSREMKNNNTGRHFP